MRSGTCCGCWGGDTLGRLRAIEGMFQGSSRSVEGPLIFLGWIRSSLLSVLRSLGDRGGRKIILSWSTDPLLCASRYVDEFVAFPGDETDEGVWRSMRGRRARRVLRRYCAKRVLPP